MPPAYTARLLPEAQRVRYCIPEPRHLVGLGRPDVVVTEREYRDLLQAEAFDEMLNEHQLAVKARVRLGEGSVNGWTTFDAAPDYAGDAAESTSPHPNDPALPLSASCPTSFSNGAVHSRRTPIVEQDKRCCSASPERVGPPTSAAFASQTPLARNATTEAISESVAFLASDRAAFVSDEVMNVTAGYFATLLRRTKQ